MIKTQGGAIVGTPPPSPATGRGRQFLRMPEVNRKTGLPPTKVYYLMKQGRFPAAIKIGARTVVWDAGEVEVWMAECVATRGAA